MSTIKNGWWHPHCSWQKVASVLHELKGMGYLVAFDYFSRYVKVAGMEKKNKVNWDHQDTEGHICNKVQNREPPKSVIWTVFSVWICQVCQVITKGFKHTTSSPEITKAAVIFQQQAKSPAFEPNRSWHRSVHQGPAEPGCLIVKAAEKPHLYEVKRPNSTTVNSLQDGHLWDRR